MKKIPTIYLRDPEDRAHVTDEINPECQWVFDGEGVATRKFDGTCLKKDENGEWWARREVKKGKPFPENFQLVVDYDEVTGKWQGWIPIEDSPFYKFWEEAIVLNYGDDFEPGTYELIGPKINGNPDNVQVHELVRHGLVRHNCPDYTPIDLINLCRLYGQEGIVWHHPDGRMAKLKVRDFK